LNRRRGLFLVPEKRYVKYLTDWTRYHTIFIQLAITPIGTRTDTMNDVKTAVKTKAPARRKAPAKAKVPVKADAPVAKRKAKAPAKVKPVPSPVVEEQGDEEEELTAGQKMSQQLKKYRIKNNYKACTSASGSSSASCADDLAEYLGTLTIPQILSLADKVCGTDSGFHASKYAKLNPGQQRMNAGNKLRSRLKNGEWEIPAKGEKK
jgi:hypothetical protein